MMETFFAGLMGVGGVAASIMCVLEWIMYKPSETRKTSETRKIIALFFFALWAVGVIGVVITGFV